MLLVEFLFTSVLLTFLYLKTEHTHTHCPMLNISPFIVTFCCSVERYDYSHPFNSFVVRKLIANTYQKPLSNILVSDVFTHKIYSISRSSIKMVNNIYLKCSLCLFLFKLCKLIQKITKIKIIKLPLKPGVTTVDNFLCLCIQGTYVCTQLLENGIILCICCFVTYTFLLLKVVWMPSHVNS